MTSTTIQMYISSLRHATNTTMTIPVPYKAINMELLNIHQLQIRVIYNVLTWKNTYTKRKLAIMAWDYDTKTIVFYIDACTYLFQASRPLQLDTCRWRKRVVAVLCYILLVIYCTRGNMAYMDKGTSSYHVSASLADRRPYNPAKIASSCTCWASCNESGDIETQTHSLLWGAPR